MVVLNPQTLANDGVVKPTVLAQIQQNGIDLTVKSITRIKGHAEVHLDSKRLPEAEKLAKTRTFDNRQLYKLKAGEAYVIDFNEEVKVPKDACGLLIHRSTFNRCGCLITGSVFDSGYHGMVSATAYPRVDIFIEDKCRVAQIIFFEADAAKQYDGQYQNSGLGDKDGEKQKVL